ncbi:hypothetical protein IGB31_24180 [Pseudomonas putida]|nr:hypothetical protein IGB31_24180 [Pseudomonas putida]RFQ03414.1 hypothetical protein D0O09_09255 [Pseudomonas putida]
MRQDYNDSCSESCVCYNLGKPDITTSVRSFGVKRDLVGFYSSKLISENEIHFFAITGNCNFTVKAKFKRAHYGEKIILDDCVVEHECTIQRFKEVEIRRRARNLLADAKGYFYH